LRRNIISRRDRRRRDRRRRDRHWRDRRRPDRRCRDRHWRDRHWRDMIEFVYDALPSEFQFDLYLGEYTAHTLHYGSEILSINAMTTLVDVQTSLEAIDKIYKDTVDVSTWLSLFVTGFMQVMVDRYLDPIKPEQIENLTTDAEPSLSDYTLPFFSSPPRPRNQVIGAKS
jgi:hypothetical protein